MLRDVTFSNSDPTMALVLSVISGGRPVMPMRMSRGLYLCNHWNFNNLIKEKTIERWRETPYRETPWEEYGVCDDPEQPVNFYNLDGVPEQLCVAFVQIEKSKQSSTGGWRWHKWGSYIGSQKPTAEYLYDEPLIDYVYTFHIYELDNPSLI